MLIDIKIGYFRGSPHLIEWKVSKKPKRTIQSLYDYPLQVAAYIGATNYSSNTQYIPQVSLRAVNCFSVEKVVFQHENPTKS